MASSSIKHKISTILAFSIISFSSAVQAQIVSLPPIQTYFTDNNGKQIGVKERWALDNNGERHGKYMEFNKNGLLMQSSTYVHGRQTGAGVSYNNLVGSFSNPFQKRPDTKFSGSYNNGKRVGTWLGYNDITNEHVATIVYDANGRQQSITYYKNGKPTRVETSSISTKAVDIKAQVNSTQNYYILSSVEKAQFLQLQFSTPEGVMTGEQLVSSKYLKTNEIAELIKQNGDDLKKVSLILKASYTLANTGSPILLVMQFPGLREETTIPILNLQEPQVIGELIYYGLRGFGDDKGISVFVIRRAIVKLSSVSMTQKLAIENWFNKCAQKGDLEKYRNTNDYPLRRWLYDEFKNEDPYKWMNHLTEDSYAAKMNKRMPMNAPDDSERYPHVVK